MVVAGTLSRPVLIETGWRIYSRPEDAAAHFAEPDQYSPNNTTLYATMTTHDAVARPNGTEYKISWEYHVAVPLAPDQCGDGQWKTWDAEKKAWIEAE